MSYWHEELSMFGAGVLPSGAVVHDGYTVERDQSSESRWRFTYKVNGKKVTHTFDMAKRWEAAHGPHPGREIW